MTTVPFTFGNEDSPIPLSQLDANFAVTPQFANTAGNVTGNVQANITAVGTLTALSVTGNVNAGNLRTTGQLSTTGNITTGNILTGGTISALGTVTGGTVCATGNIVAGNITTGGFVSATGNVIGGNIITAGLITAAGNILTQSQISATGNIVTAANFIGNFLGNITGNIVGAPGSNTQVAYNLNGNLAAVGGLTYNQDSNVLTILGQVNTQTLVVSGTSQLVGVATAPTAPNATSNNQVATTAFVQNQINQNATNVSITGGNITVTNLTANGGNITATTFSTTNWTVREFSGNLFFQYAGANKAKLDSNGNFTTTGNVTGFGTL
jgi:filamentous hemagglutinin